MRNRLSNQSRRFAAAAKSENVRRRMNRFFRASKTDFYPSCDANLVSSVITKSFEWKMHQRNDRFQSRLWGNAWEKWKTHNQALQRIHLKTRQSFARRTWIWNYSGIEKIHGTIKKRCSLKSYKAKESLDLILLHPPNSASVQARQTTRSKCIRHEYKS